jgi:hypothetical protein
MAGAIVPYRPVTSADRVNAIDTLIDAVKPLFNDVYDRAADYPGFIQSSEPRSPIFDAARSVARLNCRLWAASDKSNYSVRANAGNAELCGPYLDDLGENPDSGDLALPFEGGQCAGAGYFVTVQYFTVNTDGSNAATPTTIVGAGGVSGFPGPIDGLRVDGAPGNLQLFLVAANGDNLLASSSAPQGGFREARITSVERAGGLPDNCGNPNPIIRPPNTVTPTAPIIPRITVNLPGVGDVEVEVSVNVDGSPKVCIPILGACEDIEINPPDADPDGGGGGGGGAPPLDPEIGPPIDSPPGGGGGGDDTNFGEPPEGRIWIGAYVELLGDLTTFGVIPRDLLGQAALSTVVGNASLNVQSDSGLTLRSTFAQIRSEWSEHIVPVVGLTVSGIRVKVNPALGYRVYPVSVADPLAEEA